MWRAALSMSQKPGETGELPGRTSALRRSRGSKGVCSHGASGMAVETLRGGSSGGDGFSGGGVPDRRERPAIRLLIVDDDVIFLDAVEALLERTEDVEVVGPAGNGDEALRRTAELLPDVITMDIDMAIVNGVEATRMIVAYFQIPVVLLTASESSERIDEALAAGAVAHLYKPQAWDDLIPTLRAIVAQRRRH